MSIKQRIQYWYVERKIRRTLFKALKGEYGNRPPEQVRKLCVDVLMREFEGMVPPDTKLTGVTITRLPGNGLDIQATITNPPRELAGLMKLDK